MQAAGDYQAADQDWRGEISRGKRGNDAALAGVRQKFEGLQRMHGLFLVPLPEDLKRKHCKARATGILKALAAIEPDRAW